MNQAHHPQKASIKSILCLCLISTALSLASPAQAQITPDNTLSSEASQLNQNLIINGALGDKIDGGATRGSNLFHSFSEFNIQDGQRVYFVNPSGIENILTRVTGGNASNIFGTLGVDGAANLFLINPNGILFGQNARLDVQGSFVGTTANGVQFGNQGLFSATNPQAPPLLTIQPSALWFNQLNQNAAIQNNSVAPAGIDAAGFNAYGLRVPDSKSLLLIGGNVSMDKGQLNANGGRVELGGLGEPGTVALGVDGDNLSLIFPENVGRASVSLTNQAGIYVTGAGGGNIAVNARNLEILGGTILTAGIGQGLGTPETVAGDITLNATGEIKVAGGSIVRNLVRLGSQGNGGKITIDSGSFSLQDGAALTASTSGVGNAGNVTVGAKNAVDLADASILSTVEAGGVGKGGNIDINAATLSLTDGAQLLTTTDEASDTQPAGRGDAGNVNVLVTGAVDIAGKKNRFPSGIGSYVSTGTVGNGGNITIDSGDFSLSDGAKLVASTSGVGNAGNVTVGAKNAVDLADAYIFSTVSAGGVGKGGNIDINAATLSLTDSAQLLTTTGGASDTQPAGRGDAGNVNVLVTGAVDIAGEKNGFPSGIRSNVETGTVGNGGNITIDSGDFSLSDGAKLTASTSGVGNAGNVTVGAKNAVSFADAGILSEVSAGGVGKGGNIDINAATLSLTDGAQLLTTTDGASDTQPAGRGDAGNVNVKVTGAFDIAGKKNGFPSGIGSYVSTGTVGNGGNITIDSGDFSLSDGAGLTAETRGQGNAGNVTVGAKNAVFLVNASIFSTVEAGGVGKGGNIDINAATLSLTDSAQLLTLTRGASDTQPAGRGDAGNVNVLVTGAVDIAGEKNRFLSGIFSLVETGTVGNGGNITIDSGDFSLSDGAQLSASTFGQGNAGNVTVRAKDAISLANNGGILSIVEAGGVGKGANIYINAATLSLTDGAQLLTITRGASATQPAGQGDAGNVNVLVTGAVDITGEKNGFSSGIFSYVGTGTVGNGGNITIDSGSFSLSDGARLVASTGGQGLDSPNSQAGNITLNTTGKVEVVGADSAIHSTLLTGGVGNGGNISIDSGSFSLSDGARLSASTYGQGNAGNVTVRANDAISLANGDILSAVEAGGVGKGGNIDINAATLSLTDGAQLLTITREASATQPAGRGDAGNVNVKVTGAVDIAGEKNDFISGISSLVGTGTVGNGGNIFIDSGDFSLRDGAQLVASTYGQGNAGNVNVKVTGAVDIAGEKNGFKSGIRSFVETGTVGNGGNITIDSGSFSLRDGAQLEASTYGQGNAGNVTVDAKDAISLAGNAYIFSTVEAGGVGKGGNIDINAATLSLTDGAQLLTLTRGASATQPAGQGNAGNVNVKVTGAVDIAGEKNGFPSAIFSYVSTGTVGNGGNIFIDSGDFSLRDGAYLAASTSGVGNAGNVTVGAKNAISLAGNAYILSTVEAGGVGKGGNIDINATTLSLTDGAQLLTITRGASATQPAGRGDAGNVNVKVTGAVDIAGEKNDFSSGIRSNVGTGTVGNGGNIFIDSGSFSLSDGAQLVASTTGRGNAGNVTVRAKDAIFLANADILSTVEAGGVGKGGNIYINAATLSLTDGAQLLTITRGASATQPAGRGDAGNVNVLVTGAVDIAGEKNGFPSGIRSNVGTGTVGNGGNITIDSGSFSLRDGAQLSASTSGVGNAGNVTVGAKDVVTVSGTSQESGDSSALFTFTDSTSTGIGGDITVNTNIFRVSDGALLDARTRNNQKGGNITVNANIFEALNGGQLTTTTSSNGRAGKITVNADDKLIISGIDPSYSDRITNFPDRVANIGANSGLFVSSTGSGITGDIEINSPKITLDNQGKLNAESASGNGGNINVNSDFLLLRHGAQISTNAGTEKLGGDGGNININSRFIVAVPNENSDISANAFTGTGGNIQINSQGIFGIQSRPKLTEKSDITASSELGVLGVTNINTPDNSSIQNSFTELSPNVINTNALIANSCISRGIKRQENSFTITGSGALRNSPGDVLISAYTTGDVRSVEPTSRPWKKGDPIIEPQGLYRLPNGQLILSRSCST
ncbi:two-partner secretion domain-containing protein [Nostoc favosum]|uniref:Filamentous hemagglutinin N-terminal domain-containing protein n=1 Tax=Nostoc favosum CHAB5714 TaxID=2780399 RepID=A0ABS8IAE3_9NOSO|nr:filamentous hemagglutinin N-terminal domain-containing protein [Nostoc favosum]MCC5600733.1 filamentous hemagglutinin N-terminal domain-containing protein [Nostoc favosum CHAB5714]